MCARGERATTERYENKSYTSVNKSSAGMIISIDDACRSPRHWDYSNLSRLTRNSRIIEITRIGKIRLILIEQKRLLNLDSSMYAECVHRINRYPPIRMLAVILCLSTNDSFLSENI